MDKNPLNQGVVSAHGQGVGVVTQKMIRERAAEIALLNGRTTHEYDTSDGEQARRELSGGPEVDPETAILESLSEADRSNELPEAEVFRAPESPLEDEDAEGRSETEQLVEEGAQEAARDQCLAAARAAQKEDEVPNPSHKWAVSKRASEALVPCSPAGRLAVTPPHRELKTPGAGTEVQPTNAVTQAGAVSGEVSAGAADPNQKADHEAIEAWENEGDPN